MGPTDPAVDAMLQARVVNPRLGTDVGLVVIDAATGTLVSGHNAEAMMLPASNMKIVTAVDILQTMGSDATFHTRVRAGSASNDIVLEGGGDPLLTRTDLEGLAKDAAPRLSKDTKVIVHIDRSRFPETGKGPGWTDQYLPWVATPVVPLARLGYYGPDPMGDAVRVFAAKLRSLGFHVKVAEQVSASAGDVLADASPHSVGDAVSVMLSHSENNVAEVLFRQVAAATGRPTTWQGAHDAAVATLAALDIDATTMRLLDGSGLSRKDRVTPAFLADVLRLARVTRPERFSVMFTPQALPVAGMTGTLATAYGRYVTKHARCARGDVHAKTGSLFDTISLSGIAETGAGDERIFSILVNHRPQAYSALSARQVLDGLTATITGCWN
jgi:D-alanyl-D-alanine carboxypeptidase/D-alanyl-D-alanine-endopeptidase (penicillin-binding protein 4)